MIPIDIERPPIRAAAVLLAATCIACDTDAGVVDARIEPPEACDTETIALELDRGEALVLPSRDTVCLELRSAPAGYAVAFADGQWSEVARRERSLEPSDVSRFDIAVRDLGGGEAASGVTAAPERSPDRTANAPDFRVDIASADHGTCDDAASGTVRCRSEPWREGERFHFSDPNVTLKFPQGDSLVEVVLVRDPFVFAVPVAADPPPSATPRARLSEWADGVIDEFFPLLRSALTPMTPATSEGSGQIMVVFVEGSARRGVALNQIGPDGVSGYIALSLELLTGPAPAAPHADVRLLGHEVTHLWQARYLWDAPSEPGESGVPGPRRWAIEGTATWAEMEVVRRLAEYPLDGNRCDGGDDPLLDYYLRGLARSEGGLQRGYHHSMSFLHDLRVRAVAAGATEAEALRQVMRGALEGWYGLDRTAGLRREGLTGRMRRLIDPDWEPVEALLTWAASAALDDRTASPVFQQPSLCRAWDTTLGPRWGPVRVVTAGSGANARVRGRSPGSAGYILVRPSQTAANLVLERSVPHVRFMVARYH
ncbi:MAG: hypothetical protein ACOC8B_05960 [Gemmatimonadota bacterium]